MESQAAAAKEIVQHCMLPRLFLSPKDAMYCVEFLRQIHKLGPPNLRLLSVVDRLFKELGFMVRCCTSRESTNLGIFFADLMALVSRWRDKNVFEQECLEAEAFKSYKSGNLQPVSHDEFIRLSANWHKRLTLDVFKSCIVSKDYMQMKNVLLVLNRMVRIYPATKEDAEELLLTLKPISENDPREDLKTLARMYCTGLEMSIRDRQMVDSRQEYAGLPPPARRKQPATKEKKPQSETPKSPETQSDPPIKKESRKDRKTNQDREDRKNSHRRSSEIAEPHSTRQREPHSKQEERPPAQDSSKDISRPKKRKTDEREVPRSSRAVQGTRESKRDKDSRNGKKSEADSNLKREAERSSKKEGARKEGHSRDDGRRQARDKPTSDSKRGRNAHTSRHEPRVESRGQQGSNRDKKRSRSYDKQSSHDQSKRSRNDKRQPKPSNDGKRRNEDSREFKKDSSEPPKRERSDRRERMRR